MIGISCNSLPSWSNFCHSQFCAHRMRESENSQSQIDFKTVSSKYVKDRKPSLWRSSANTQSLLFLCLSVPVQCLRLTIICALLLAHSFLAYPSQESFLCLSNASLPSICVFFYVVPICHISREYLTLVPLLCRLRACLTSISASSDLCISHQYLCFVSSLRHAKTSLHSHACVNHFCYLMLACRIHSNFDNHSLSF